MTPIFPANKDEWYVKASFLLANGGEQQFEMPAVFNDDDTLNMTATQEKLDQTIKIYELLEKIKKR